MKYIGQYTCILMFMNMIRRSMIKLMESVPIVDNSDKKKKREKLRRERK